MYHMDLSFKYIVTLSPRKVFEYATFHRKNVFKLEFDVETRYVYITCVNKKHLPFATIYNSKKILNYAMMATQRRNFENLGILQDVILNAFTLFYFINVVTKSSRSVRKTFKNFRMII